MIKSPCKTCEKHKKEFPGCMDDCDPLNEIQTEAIDDNSSISAVNCIGDSYSSSNKRSGGKKGYSE